MNTQDFFLIRHRRASRHSPKTQETAEKKTKLKLGREKRKKEAEQGEGERLRNEKKKFHEKIFLLEFDYVVLGSRREAIERRFVGKWLAGID